MVAYSVGWMRRLGTQKSREVSEGGGAPRWCGGGADGAPGESMKAVITDGVAVCSCQGGGGDRRQLQNMGGGREGHRKG